MSRGYILYINSLTSFNFLLLYFVVSVIIHEKRRWRLFLCLHRFIANVLCFLTRLFLETGDLFAILS